MENKKILISGLVAMCLTMVLGLGLLFAGMFTKEEVKYTGQDQVYIDCLWGNGDYNYGTTIYEIDQEISYSSNYSIFNKDSQKDLEIYSEKLLEDIENTIIEEQAKNIIIASPYDYKMYNISISNDTLADLAVEGILQKEANDRFGENVWKPAFGKNANDFLNEREIKTHMDGTIYGTALSDDTTSVDLSPLQEVVNKYIFENTTTLNFTSEIIELIFGSLLIISSIVGGTIIIYRNKKQ